MVKAAPVVYGKRSWGLNFQQKKRQSPYDGPCLVMIRRLWGIIPR
jgi:hypothetical protein